MADRGKKPTDSLFVPKLTKEEKELILQWGREDVRIKEVCRRLDNKVSKQYVQQFLKKNGINPTIGARLAEAEKQTKKLIDKWGEKYLNKEDRADYAYQSFREKFRNKRRNVRNYGQWEWNICFGDLEFPTHCPILGIELDYFAYRLEENAPTFDRVDPLKGYVKGNVIICSWRANRIKNDGTAEEHQKISDFMKNFL